MFDVIIIGNGPAGISAALYACRGGLKTLIIGRDFGALQKADKIENYYGFAQPVSGKYLVSNGIEQATRLGTTIITSEVVGVSYEAQYVVKTKDEHYTAPSVIIATGATRSTPAIRGLTDFEGHGVSYCAECDAFFYRGKDVAVLGDGHYALHEAKALLPLARSVTLLTNGTNPKIQVPEKIQVNEKKLVAFHGTDVLDSVKFHDNTTQNVSGVFIAVGVAGSDDLAKKLGAETKGTKIVVNERMETNLPGLYAAGDCTGGMLQIAKAVYEGATAGREVIKYIKKP
ncbi:NAD(P)/FAD-dependent oxidoreductase [Anaerosinus massiliensis]|uniref:NAD(P)/FAD-dependent oxidoreductase n=1 Tax=Massilibacillus massiliensis TaxID=1806837 RepID=UPI000ACE9ED9|nr:FAD-dependent oxidoreductase [Massilibacillus massiliensis]